MHSQSVIVFLVLALVSCGILAACGEQAEPTLTKEVQASATPTEVLENLKLGNEMFARGEKVVIDHLADVKATAKGQWPLVAFVDCIDSRVAVDVIFNLGLGMAFSANVAGNVVNPDILGSLEYACAVAGSKLVVVLGHTNCGAIKGAADGVELGNLTGLLKKLQPALDAVPDDGSPRTSKNEIFTGMASHANVRHQIGRIRRESPVLKKLEDEGKIRIVGAVYDVATAKVTWHETA